MATVRNGQEVGGGGQADFCFGFYRVSFWSYCEMMETSTLLIALHSSHFAGGRDRLC